MARVVFAADFNSLPEFSLEVSLSPNVAECTKVCLTVRFRGTTARPANHQTLTVSLENFAYDPPRWIINLRECIMRLLEAAGVVSSISQCLAIQIIDGEIILVLKDSFLGAVLLDHKGQPHQRSLTKTELNQFNRSTAIAIWSKCEAVLEEHRKSQLVSAPEHPATNLEAYLTNPAFGAF